MKRVGLVAGCRSYGVEDSEGGCGGWSVGTSGEEEGELRLRKRE